MSPLSRRTFLRHSAVAATAGLTAVNLRPSVWAAPVGANGAIRLGLIGCGAKGTAHVPRSGKIDRNTQHSGDDLEP